MITKRKARNRFIEFSWELTFRKVNGFLVETPFKAALLVDEGQPVLPPMNSGRYVPLVKFHWVVVAAANAA